MLGAIGASALAVSSEQSPSFEKFRLAEETRSILTAISHQIEIQQTVHTGETAPRTGILPSTRRADIFSFSALQDSGNLRTDGFDELGRPVRIDATKPALNGPLTFRTPSPADQTDQTRFSFSALSGDGADLLALVTGNAAPADDAPKSEETMNFKGQRVTPATVPYFADFESGARGYEWDSQSNVTALGEYTNFTGPLRRAREVMHLTVEPGQSYIFQLDLYMIGMGSNLAPERSGMFTVTIDGAPMIENTFGGLRLAQDEADEDDEGDRGEAPGNGYILRELRTQFVANSGVVQIVIEGDSGPGFGAGSWGFDNVLVDEAPETALGSFAQSDFAPDTEAIGPNRITTGRGYPQLAPTEQDRIRDPRPFKEARGSNLPPIGRRNFNIDDFFPDDDEDDFDDEPDDEPDDEEDEDVIPDEEIPSPGPAALFLIGGAAGLRRRR